MQFCHSEVLDGSPPSRVFSGGVVFADYGWLDCFIGYVYLFLQCDGVAPKICFLQGNLGHAAIDVELDSLPDHAEPEAAKPYFILSHFDHRISTRQVTFHGGMNRRRTQSELATILYNLVNEPWLKYTPSLIADCGFASHLYTVSKFHKEALYIETATCVLPQLSMC